MLNMFLFWSPHHLNLVYLSSMSSKGNCWCCLYSWPVSLKNGMWSGNTKVISDLLTSVYLLFFFDSSPESTHGLKMFCMNYLSLYSVLPPKQPFKTIHIYYFTVCVGQESMCDLPMSSGSRNLQSSQGSSANDLIHGH